MAAWAILLVAATLPIAQAAAASPVSITADGGRYSGPVLDGKHHGQGKIEWPNGTSYEGEFENGLFSGKGKYQSRSGAGFMYEGDFKLGSMTGQGRYTGRDGSVYVGEFLNDRFHGQGRYEMSTGFVYEGTFRDGLFEGKGKLAGNGEVYEGQFQKGKYAGAGEMRYADGRKYKGEFANNLFQGKGRLESADGKSYEGDFDKGEFTGKGIYQARDGARHVGSFAKWRPHGAGTYTDARGNVYEGTFTDGDLSGVGRLSSKDGSRYEGELKSWRSHGKGVYRAANGDEYKGSFAAGVFNGEGVYTYAKAKKDGRASDSGTWRYGKLVDPEAEKQEVLNVETALYNQRSLLDKTLASLAPRDPAKINLYLLAIGGDGSQEVFRRETDYVQKQFDRDFGTQGRSLVLVNSRSTVGRLPLATITSIRESLAAIAARMDKEKDILFLFLTSHGSKEHEFTLDQNGMNLRDLSAKELGTLLKESGIRWKAVVVSACYAGGFTDPIKDDNTMVIAAARHDRRSFGCADENDFTYFGRAFFQEALPQSATFGEAFRKAEALVNKWEKEDFKGSGKPEDELHSLPQLHYPPRIAQYLLRWRLQLEPRPTANEMK